MNVIPFARPAPTGPVVVAEVARLASFLPGWLLEVHYADDGRPSVSAEHRLTRRVVGAHWDDTGHWAVLAESGVLMTSAPDLASALQSALT